MSCRTCGRSGLCRTCCCVHPDHRRDLPNLTECRLCRHPLPDRRRARQIFDQTREQRRTGAAK